jgi:hypothetical protein
MLGFLHKVKQYLWAFVEVVFVTDVADNVLKFVNAIPSQSLVGLAIVLALVFLIANRMKPN